MPPRKKPKHPGGRPPIANPRSTNLNIRLLPATKAKWQSAAESQGLSLTAWVCLVCDDASRGVKR